MLRIKFTTMIKQNFKNELKQLINSFGYWSDEVFNFNTEMQTVLHYHIWLKWHNEVKAELKQ